jgi:hypothetical protein
MQTQQNSKLSINLQNSVKLPNYESISHLGESKDITTSSIVLAHNEILLAARTSMVLLTSKLEVQETAVLNNLSHFSPFFFLKERMVVKGRKNKEKKARETFIFTVRITHKNTFPPRTRRWKTVFTKWITDTCHLVVLGGKVRETVKCEYVNSFLQQIAYLVL